MKQVSIPLTEQQIKLYHSLAQEIAQGYMNKQNILKTLSITEQQYEEISSTAVFQRILSQAVAEWSSANNSAKRIRLKAQWTVEEGLPHIFTSMTDINEPMSARVEAFKAIAKIGQLDHQEVSPGADRSFRIEINIGHGAAPITIDSEVITPQFEIEEEENFIPGHFEGR